MQWGRVEGVPWPPAYHRQGLSWIYVEWGYIEWWIDIYRMDNGDIEYLNIPWSMHVSMSILASVSVYCLCLVCVLSVIIMFLSLFISNIFTFREMFTLCRRADPFLRTFGLLRCLCVQWRCAKVHHFLHYLFHDHHLFFAHYFFNFCCVFGFGQGMERASGGCRSISSKSAGVKIKVQIQMRRCFP